MGAQPGHLDQLCDHGEPSGLRSFGDRTLHRFIAQLADGAAPLANQELRAMRRSGRGAGNIGVAARKTMNEALRDQKVEGAINGNRRRPALLLAKPVDDFVSADCRMARRNNFQHTSTLRRQAHLALSTKTLGGGKHVRYAMLMIMTRSRKENHGLTSFHLINRGQLDTLYSNR
jgi:hypothetical protein